jgi:hypothetical protein
VYLRFGAAFLAVAAGAAGLVVAVDLLRSVPGPAPSSASSVGSVPVAAGTTPIPGGRIPTPNQPDFPAPPRGAIVLSQEAGSRALGLAIVPGRATTLTRVSLLGPSGSGAGGLDVRARFGAGPALVLRPCGAGCYQADIPAGKVSRAVSVTVGHEVYDFRLPALRVPPDASELVDHAARAWKGLKTLVWRERLAGNPTDAIHTTFKAVAPDELSYTIRGGSAAVIIGGTRWDRASPTGKWQARPQNPPLRQPSPFWASAFDARVLGSGSIRGRAVWLVSFFDPSTPAWYQTAIDKQNYRTLDLTMTAASHFMHHVYGPFDLPFRLHPPEAATAAGARRP